MKLRPARAARNTDDIGLVLQTLDLDTLEEVTAVVRRYFPDEPLTRQW